MKKARKDKRHDPLKGRFCLSSGKTTSDGTRDKIGDEPTPRVLSLRCTRGVVGRRSGTRDKRNHRDYVPDAMGDLNTQVGRVPAGTLERRGFGIPYSVLPGHSPIVRRAADPSFVGYARSLDRRGL